MILAAYNRATRLRFTPKESAGPRASRAGSVRLGFRTSCSTAKTHASAKWPSTSRASATALRASIPVKPVAAFDRDDWNRVVPVWLSAGLGLSLDYLFT